MLRRTYKLLLLYFAIILIGVLYSAFTSLAEIPYLKGKFYKSVKNHLLVATDKITDDRFKKTVIAILENDNDGSWGLVVNKPIGSVPLKLLINTLQYQKDEKKKLYDVDIPIFWGGPVDKENIFILHSEEYKNETTENYKGISVTRDYKILFDIAENKGPKESLVILGYSGWGASQLEGEMEIDHWLLSEFNSQIIFEKKNN